MRRKIICLALTACLACGMLGGCSSDNGEPSSEPIAPSSSSSLSSSTPKTVDVPDVEIDGSVFKITPQGVRTYLNDLLPESVEPIPLLTDVNDEHVYYIAAIDDFFSIGILCDEALENVTMVNFELDQSSSESAFWLAYSSYINALTTLFDGEPKYASLAGDLGFYTDGDVELHGVGNEDFSIFYSYKVEDGKASFGIIPFQKEASSQEIDSVPTIDSSASVSTLVEEPNSSSPSTPSTQVLLEQDGIKITYTGMGSDYLGPKIKLRIENDSDQPITVQQRDMSINGVMIDGILSEDVRPGKIANTDISILSSYLEENDITAITDVELSFHIFHSDTWDTILDSDTVTIQI